MLERIILFPVLWLGQFLALMVVTYFTAGIVDTPLRLDGLISFVLPALISGALLGFVTSAKFPNLVTSAKWLFVPPLLLLIYAALRFPDDPDLFHPGKNEGGIATALVLMQAVQCTVYSLTVYLLDLRSLHRASRKH
jgi:hypothetical protein